MQSQSFELERQGTPETVRSILSDLRQRCAAYGLSEDHCGIVEIALAEALNNIVEHAYAPECEGPLFLRATLTEETVEIELRDQGHPLPGLTLPTARLPDASGPVESLPEGGFGWFLIHDLTEKLIYTRERGENCLCLGFRFKGEPSA